MTNCIFCKIANKSLESQILFESDELLAFKDLNPQAPMHFLVIPKKHIATTNDIKQEDAALVGKMCIETANYAKEQGFADDGYRMVFNCNTHGCQSVFHIHLHVLAQRQLGWPPG